MMLIPSSNSKMDGMMPMSKKTAENIEGTLDFFSAKLPKNADCRQYLSENISFNFDKAKKEGLNLFLSFL